MLRATDRSKPGGTSVLGGVMIVARGLVIGARLVAAALAGAVTALVIAARHGRPAAHAHLARRVALTAQALGPTFVKACQVLGTRRDVLPRVLCDELGRLQDTVAPLSPAASQAALREVYGTDLDDVFVELDPVAVAAGSVACVYRGRLPGGVEVAVKLRRPGIHRQMSADLELLRRGSRVVAVLPAMRGVPVREVVDSLCASVLGQLDFEAEAANLDRLRRNLSAISRVRVPRVLPEASRPACIVMEYIPELDVDTAADCSLVLRRGFAATTLAVVYRMLFVDGFVHCDLHPGNLYFLRNGEVVVLDAGFSAQLSERMRQLFADFFLNMSMGRGRRCAQLVLDSSLGHTPDADVDGFLVAMADLVHRNSGAAARDFSLIAFAGEMFDLQRRHGVAAAPDLVFPLLSLLVIEGTVRDLDPGVDFQAAARPVLTSAVFGR